ncbi:MAG: hypothetical protein ABOK23_02930 [Candidatus Methanoperedens sp.]|nr:hypothetical protein [Candidatus Methanoperedens sp.]MCZ7394799.1 hypothetical protein [Candidatus Methanoperedens sp.]
MNFDTRTEDTNDKLKRIEEGLRYLIDLELFDAFYDEIWSKDTARLLERYRDESSYTDLPLEETEGIKQQVVEWFGEDYGLAEIDGEFWLVSVGSIDEGGNKWWFKVKINTDNLETARKVVLLERCLPGKYCNIYAATER